MPMSLTIAKYFKVRYSTLKSKIEVEGFWTMLVGGLTLSNNMKELPYNYPYALGLSPVYDFTERPQDIVSIILSIDSLMQIFASLALIYGVKTGSKKYYLPWLILLVIDSLHLLCFLTTYLFQEGCFSFVFMGWILVVIDVGLPYLIVWTNYRYVKPQEDPTLELNSVSVSVSPGI